MLIIILIITAVLIATVIHSYILMLIRILIITTVLIEAVIIH